MDRLKFLFSEAFSFLKPFIKVLLTQSGLILMRAAQEAVMAVENDMRGLEGAKKREAAFEIIQDKLKDAGVEIMSSAVNSAIEAAVLKLNSK